MRWCARSARLLDTVLSPITALGSGRGTAGSAASFVLCVLFFEDGQCSQKVHGRCADALANAGGCSTIASLHESRDGPRWFARRSVVHFDFGWLKMQKLLFARAEA